MQTMGAPLTTLKGKVIKGQGGAAGNLKTQLPKIAEEFPEVRNCHPGTINLELEKALLVLSSDHRTRPIDWHPDHAPGEVFDLLRIQLEAPEGRVAIPAWLYIARNSDHRKTMKVHEVIALERVQVSVGDPCKIHLSRPTVELPYRAYPIIVAL